MDTQSGSPSREAAPSLNGQESLGGAKLNLQLREEKSGDQQDSSGGNDLIVKDAVLFQAAIVVARPLRAGGLEAIPGIIIVNGSFTTLMGFV